MRATRGTLHWPVSISLCDSSAAAGLSGLGFTWPHALPRAD